MRRSQSWQLVRRIFLKSAVNACGVIGRVTVIHTIIVAVFMLLTIGCVGYRVEPRAKSWPSPVSARNLKEFGGVFSNRSVDYASRQRVATNPRPGLYAFITAHSRPHDGRGGTKVEIRCSADEKVLHIRLLDEQHIEIDSVSLHRGVNFDFSRGFLDLHGPSTGVDAKAGNILAYVGRESARLYLGSTHDLLGRRSGQGAGLLFYFVPVIGGSTQWILWPQLTSQ